MYKAFVRTPYRTLEHIATGMCCYASTNGRGLGASGSNAIDAEFVGESSNLCICDALDVEGGRRHHDELSCGMYCGRC